MKPTIPPRAYFDPAILERERAVLFSPRWHLAGFARNLAEPNSYLTCELNGHSAIVQNFAGELRAFRNCCSHRFCRIRNEPAGSGPLRCPYHGWTYGKDGIPVGIPARPRFDGLTPERLQSLALQPYEVARCADLLFLSENSKAPLNEHLGTALETVTRLASALGPQIDVYRLNVGANWKLLVENTLEGYHIPLVHRDTFHKFGLTVVGTGGEGASTWARSRYNDATAGAAVRAAEVYRNRPVIEEGYLHQLVFPNLALATTFGTILSVQTFNPTGPEETELTTYLFQTKLDDVTPAARESLELINESAAAFTRKVVDEDVRICEMVQLGCHEARPETGILSDEETRVLAFHQHYLQAMAGSASTAAASGGE